MKLILQIGQVQAFFKTCQKVSFSYLMGVLRLKIFILGFFLFTFFRQFYIQKGTVGSSNGLSVAFLKTFGTPLGTTYSFFLPFLSLYFWVSIFCVPFSVI